ncbi:conserved hypothetical protein [Listeria ivanovii FSL F6-596]|nr:conserved hypothetical protein [Listeria ivanovii FSL F6-596]
MQMADNRQSNSRRIKQNMVEGSRSQQNTKRKKTNLVLNILIIVVSLLIIGSLYFVLFKTESDPADQPNKTASSTAKKEDAAKSNKTTKKEETTSDDKTETTDSNDPNVAKVITKNWKPIGTEQTGDHVNSYSSTSVDWQEKRKAFSAATDIPIADTSLWFVEQGADPATQAIGTLSAKETPDKAYRVYISWVDGEGWQPTKVEELKTNDKR